ncbi:FAD-dependent oxidoreductase [Mycoplana sp. MJR14]|uniref:NAD(P)/FAD-dependent oxidoreductase n=1 Tax=Mycoplana sp. MJR14 TaxID=3032583 RepID=UPI0023DADC91|nr:FAD-dependent oxidoreductase [Mycoplana sp. MJR14]MDF1632534.1 FAD-dependent oxidoreductase [Mycoplana sp. MJR14]
MQAITRKRQLRSSDPLWSHTRGIAVPTQRSLPDGDVDVLIVGAGIGGALMATALLDRGLDIVLVDRRKPVHGSSMASTAMIQHEIDVPLHRLAAQRGVAAARRIWQRSARAVESLTTLVGSLGIDCRMQRKKTLYLAGDAYGARALRSEAEARAEAGLTAELKGAAELRQAFGMDRTAAIVSDVSASANPAQLTAGLLRLAGSRGVSIVEGVEITDIRSVGEDNVVATSKGELVRARHVVFCTGYEFLEAVAHKSHAIVSTWAMATRPHHPRPEWLKDYLVWEGADPYLYFRSTPDGRIVVGGEDEDSADAFRNEAKLAAKSARLRRKLKALIGFDIEEPDYVWAAAFGVTADGLPMIGRVPGFRNVHAAMGYGGNGITFSQIAAEIIAAGILGHDDTDATLFSFR